MFTEQKKPKSQTENHQEQNRIAPGTVINGDLTGKGAFRIEGTLDGNLKTPGKVVIGQSGLIKGRLDCENADIEGKVTGNLTVSGTLSLRSTAVIEGEVVALKLAVEPGATFNATCQMTGGVKSLKNDEKQSA